MLELAILGLLKERSMHGYQLSKRLTDTLGGFWRVSYGSLYPTLRRLERDSAVERVFDEQEVGRRKNVYRITEKGEELFQRLLEEASAKLRTGPPKDDEADHALPVWAGILPISTVPQAPQDDPRLSQGLEPPPNVTGYRRPFPA
jgi:DNA-binding PadR family transcriptional regulator